jgi:hypothetical protein
MDTNQNTASKTPHDEFFKSLIQEKSMAAAYIKAFLPPSIVEHLDLSQLTLDENSYITEELRAYYSDIVYACPYKSSSVQITLLLEHKSTPAEYPHLQLLRYMLEIWNVRLQNKLPLAPVLPIIFYHGDRKWNYKPWHEYLAGVDENLKPYIPDFQYILTDLSQYEDDTLLHLKSSFFFYALWVMKHKGNLNLLIKTIDQVSFDLATQETKIFKQLLVYILRANPNKKEEAGTLVQKLIEPLKEYDMTLYDQFVEEVSQKYLQEKQQLELTVRELLVQIELSEKTRRVVVEAERQEAQRAIKAKELEAQRAIKAKELEAQRAIEAKELEIEAKELEAQRAIEAKELEIEAKELEAQQMKTLAELEHNKLLDTVKKLLLLGMNVEQITDITGITGEEIEVIQKSLLI